MTASSSFETAPDFLKLLANDVRWNLLSALAESDRRVQELVAGLQRPQNLISYHLRLLRDAKVVKERRSNADGRDIYYSLNVETLRHHYQHMGQALHPALSSLELPTLTDVDAWRVLFLCTHNSARSQLAEGILRAVAGERVQVFSAGSEPGRVHPLAVRAARAIGIDISDQRSKHMAEFAHQRFDDVITVCDRVREVCPIFPDDPHEVHWSIPDPVAVPGSEAEKFQAFLRTAQELMTRIQYLQLMKRKSGFNKEKR